MSTTKTHYMRPGASWSPCRRPAHRCVYTAAWSDVTCGNCLRSTEHREALALTPQPADVQRYAARVQDMITSDIADGTVPASVRSFSELHDHVDANMYVITALDGYQPRGDEGSEVITSDAETDMANAVMDAVDAWLRTRGATDWCCTCGNPVHNGQCACWCLIAQALQQYAGYDHDESADEAARLWADLDTEERERVWSAEYARDHFQMVNGQQEPIPVYPRPAGLLTRAERAMAQDATENALSVLGDAGVATEQRAALTALHGRLSDAQPCVLTDAELSALWGALSLSVATCDPRCTGDLDGMRAFRDHLGHKIGATS
jgi:hypothetical protein